MLDANQGSGGCPPDADESYMHIHFKTTMKFNVFLHNNNTYIYIQKVML